jgi:hypothetical protein
MHEPLLGTLAPCVTLQQSRLVCREPEMAVCNPADPCVPMFAVRVVPCSAQVVWLSDRGHAVRIPVSVNFRAVLAPEVLAPVPTAPDFR